MNEIEDDKRGVKTGRWPRAETENNEEANPVDLRFVFWFTR